MTLTKMLIFEGKSTAKPVYGYLRSLFAVGLLITLLVLSLYTFMQEYMSALLDWKCEDMYFIFRSYMSRKYF